MKNTRLTFLFRSNGNKPAASLRIAEPEANPAYSVDYGDYVLTFQNKRNGAARALEVGKAIAEQLKKQ